jgi:SSS family solute:Na+ symporter
LSDGLKDSHILFARGATTGTVWRRIIMSSLHNIDYVVIVIYLIITTIIGLLLTRRASASLEHYFLGGRTMPWWLLGIAGMSGWFDLTGTMVITSFLYLLGPRGLYIEFRGGACLVLAFMLAYTGKWHRRSGCMTYAEWLTLRFGETRAGEGIRLLTAIMSVVFTAFMLSYLVRGTSLFVGMIIPLPPTAVTITLIALTALYTMFAGFYGVVVTDLIQAVIIIISCVVIATMAWSSVPGQADLSATASLVTGNARWTETLPVWQTTMPAGYEPYSLLVMVAGFYLLRNILAGLGCGADNRYFGARNDRECGLLSLLQGCTVMFRWPLMIGFAVMGIYLVRQLYPDPAVVGQAATLIHSYYPNTTAGAWHDLTSWLAVSKANCPPELAAGLEKTLGADWPAKLPLVGHGGIVNPEQILPAVLKNCVPAGMAGLIIVAMLAAMKGSLAGVVNGSSAFFVKDIYQNFLRPKASTRELISVSWVTTMMVMAAGVYLGLMAQSINAIWGWLVMSLGAGQVAPTVLRLYWWRCNAWGVVGGMMMGIIGSLIQRFVWPGMLEWQQFTMMTLLSFAGTIGGSLLTAPTDMTTLVKFYRITRPFGFWGPVTKIVHQEWSEERVKALRHEHRSDIITVPFAMLAQITLFLLSMQLVIKAYRPFFYTLPVFLFAAAGMYWFWWRNLPAADAPNVEKVELAPISPIAAEAAV